MKKYDPAIEAEPQTYREKTTGNTPIQQTDEDKLNWVDFYMGLAFAISQKSPDAQTKHGCFICDEEHRPLGFGYNGFPRGVDDTTLPTVRPDKYPWMFHSEENAVANCILRPKNGTAFVTGQCCSHCLYTLWQHGITCVYMAVRHGSHLITGKDLEWQNEFVIKTGIRIHYVIPYIGWLKKTSSILD